jgi:hypothetical protein
VRWRTDFPAASAYGGERMRGIPDAQTRRSEIMSLNTDYVAKMETQLKKWDADLDALAAVGEKASADTRAAYHKSIKDLRANRDSAQKTFKEMQAASQSAVAQTQAKMGAAWETMQKALAKVTSDLRK